MGFESALTRRLGTIGKYRVHFGTFTNGAGDSGGDIDTKMKLCIFLIPFAKTATADVYVDEDFSSGPLDGSAITIVSALDADGYWLAVGI